MNVEPAWAAQVLLWKMDSDEILSQTWSRKSVLGLFGF